MTAQLLSGCTGTSPKVDFYTLTADNDMTGFPGAAQRCRSTPIDIGPISWPRYLDQPRIVTRASPNRLELDEFHRWGGSLQDDFQRVLIKDLSGLLQSERVGNFERTSRFKPDYRVVLEVRQFDGQLGGEVILDVRWGIIRHASGEVLVVKNSQLQEASPEPTHDALVNASSRAVAGLAREIAAALAGLCPAG
ncbi:MAG: PqiC family protein [Gammaproteobacteria bacterium]